jgi:cell division initiation protein
MERFAPIDIDHTNLRTVLKGYDRGQVDVLLGRVKNEMAGLLSELKDAKDEIQRQRVMIEAYAAQENVLKETLLVAQRTADELRANAHREADSVVAQAHRTAEDTQRQYQAKINDLRWELEKLRMDRQKFQADFRAHLEGYLRGLTEDLSANNGNGNGNQNGAEPSQNIRAAIDVAP